MGSSVDQASSGSSVHSQPVDGHHQHPLTLPLLFRFLTALSSSKFPTQHQLSNIISATLDSPLFSAEDQKPAPQIISSTANLLSAVQKFTDAKNKNNQLQRLAHALFTHPPTLPSAPDMPAIPDSPRATLKRLVMALLGGPSEMEELLSRALELVVEVFNSEPPQESRTEEALDRLVARLARWLADVHRALGTELAAALGLLCSSIVEGAERVAEQDELRDVFGLVGECVAGVSGGDEWERLAGHGQQLAALCTEHEETLLKPLRELQELVIDLFNHFEDKIYSPKLYDALRSCLDKLGASAALVAEPVAGLVGSLEGIRTRLVTEDELWQDLVACFRIFAADFADLVASFKNPGRVADRLGALCWKGVVDYVLPRVLLLMKEIPLPRIEFVSPMIEAVIDPLSLISTSGFMPTSLTSTTIHRFEISRGPSQSDEQTLMRSAAALPTPVTRQMVSIVGLRLMARNIGFYVHKKVDPNQGFLGRTLAGEFEDEGKVDVFLGMGTDDGLALNFEVDWNYHADGTTNNTGCGGEDQQIGGLFVVKNLKVNLEGFGFFPHDTTHPILNWLLKPTLERYLQSSLTKTIEGYVDQQLGRLSLLLGKARARWHETTGSSKSAWERAIEAAQACLADSDNESSASSAADEDEEGGTKTRVDGRGIKLEAEDGSYEVWIGMGEHALPGKGVGGPGSLAERIEDMSEHAGAAVDQQVGVIVEGIAQGVAAGEKAGWESEAFDLR